MKKYLLGTAFAIASIMSCTNEAIEIDSIKTQEPIYYNKLTLTVEPSDLFSSYDFKDTYHKVEQLGELYRKFYSESGMYIQARTLIYNRSGELVDSIVKYLDNTNSINNEFTLETGDYYAINTLTFATKDKDSFWNLRDKEKMSTANLQPRNRFSLWCILSYSSESFSIKKDEPARVVTKPKPVGCVAYVYFQNFQYKSESTYGKVEDNGIRELDLYTKSKTESFVLDPNVTNRYNYKNDIGDSWYYAYSTVPSDYADGSWEFFKSNVYGYCYFLDPSVKLIFGYVLDGETKFHGYGEATYDLDSGQTYLAYWDYFKVGNPYFGIANNYHWNTYSITGTRGLDNEEYSIISNKIK